MKAIMSQDIGNKGVIAMDMILSRASVPSFGREATSELERRPFDQNLRARLETMEIDPPDATTRFQHRLKQYYKWTDEFAARTLDGFWRFLRILTLVATLWYFVISDGLSSSELRRRLNQSSAGQGDVFRVGAGLSEHFHSVREGIRRPISTSSPAAAIPLATRSRAVIAARLEDVVADLDWRLIRYAPSRNSRRRKILYLPIRPSSRPRAGPRKPPRRH